MSFCTALNCMDGRTQLPVIEYLQRRFGVSFVDMITEPGINRVLAESGDSPLVQSILSRCAVSVERHHSVGLAVVGHDDCAGNPVSENEQHRHIRQAVERLAARYPRMDIIGLWVDAARQVHEIVSRSAVT